MSDFKDNYTIGVGKTVLELFKKVLEKKKELQTGGTQAPQNVNTGQQVAESQTGKVQQTGDQVQQTEIQTQQTVAQVEIGTVTLTKVEQYYDGTIFEGSITGGDEYDIQFNIKDRTKTTLSETATSGTTTP